MRRLNIDWTNAQWNRLSLFAQSEEFGVEMLPERIAPFKFVVQDKNRVDVMIDNIYVGKISSDCGIALRDDFPVAYDRYLTRAVNALCEINDEVGKLMRAQKRHEVPAAIPAPAGNILVRRNDGRHRQLYDLDQDLFRKGVLGLVAKGDLVLNWIRERQQISVGVPNKSTFITFDVIDDIEATCFSTRYMVTPDIEPLLRSGGEFWDNSMDADKFYDALAQDKMDLYPEIDKESFRYFTEQHQGPHEAVEEGPFSITFPRSQNMWACVKYNGLPIYSMPNQTLFKNIEPYPYFGPLIGGQALSQDHLNDLRKIVMNGFVKSFDVDPSTIVELNEKFLEEKVENIDFGYYG